MPLRNVRFVLPVSLLAASSLMIGGCGSAQPDDVAPPSASAPSMAVRELDQHAVLLDSSDPAELALTVSQTVFARAEAVVLADADDTDARAQVAATAVAVHAPALLARGEAADVGLADELNRLGARVAVVVGDENDAARAVAQEAGIPVVEASPEVVPAAASQDGADGADGSGRAGQGSELASDAYPTLDEGDEKDLLAELEGALGGPTSEGDASLLSEVLAVVDRKPGQEAAIATLRAAGAVTAAVPGGDLGAPEAVRTLDAAQALAVVGVGPSFGSTQDFGWRVAAAERAALLPTGTQHLLPARYVTTTADRWDDPASVVAQARTSAAAYAQDDAPDDAADGEAADDGAADDDTENTDGASDPGPVVPALLLTASASSSLPGDDGNWVTEEPVDDLRPLVAAARAAGVYVLLDVGAGSSPLVDDVRALEPLLSEPGVGVSVHPEHRRGEGTTAEVSAAEVQDVAGYLAEVATREGLPESMLVVHQTRPESVRDRGRLTSSPQVQVVLTADRTGGTTTGEWVWDHVSADVPAGVHLGWSGPTYPTSSSPGLVPTDPAVPVLIAGP